MREVDGADGGGQLLRTGLTLSALTGESLEMEGIRGGRPEPGLRPQHLTAVELLSQICDATVSDVEIGTDSLTFEPGPIESGRYEVDVGTAGSVTLLFDAVLPLATAVDGPLVVTAEGGTDVTWSPTMAYYRRVKLPLLRQHGLQATVSVARRGFYPVGGGRATVSIGPSTLEPLAVASRGPVESARVISIESADLADQAVAQRQAEAVENRLAGTDVTVVERTLGTWATDSPGSAVCLRLDGAETVAGFDALGERGTPAEDIGQSAVDDALAFLEGDAAVDRHTADQLLVFLAMAGGEVRIPAETDHVATARDLVETFGFETTLERTASEPLLRAAGRSLHGH